MIKIHSEEEIKGLIKRIDDIKLDEVEIETVKELFKKLLTGIHWGADIFNPDQIRIFRGKKCREKIRPNNKKEFLYPPLDKARVNRVNRAGHQIFYATSLLNSVFYELDAMPGDWVAVSDWKTNDFLLLNRAGQDKADLNNLPQYLLVEELIRKIFGMHVNPTNWFPYKLTIALSEILLGPVSLKSPIGNQKDFSGLVYPTVKMKFNALNFAIRPPYVDGHMDLVHAALYKVLDLNSLGYLVESLDFANEFSSSGEILWQGKPNPMPIVIMENSKMGITCIGGGNIVTKDSAGNIIKSEPNSGL